MRGRPERSIDLPSTNVSQLSGTKNAGSREARSTLQIATTATASASSSIRDRSVEEGAAPRARTGAPSEMSCVIVVKTPRSQETCVYGARSSGRNEHELIARVHVGSGARGKLDHDLRAAARGHPPRLQITHDVEH